MTSRYTADGEESEFEPGSRGRVLRNRLGIRRVGDMEQVESKALTATQEWAVAHYDIAHRFTATDICVLHRHWLGDIYAWAGSYRNVNMAKGGFMFAAAMQVPRLMAAFSGRELAEETPCVDMDVTRLAMALARTHVELIHSPVSRRQRSLFAPAGLPDGHRGGIAVIGLCVFCRSRQAPIHCGHPRGARWRLRTDAGVFCAGYQADFGGV